MLTKTQFKNLVIKPLSNKYGVKIYFRNSCQLKKRDVIPDIETRGAFVYDTEDLNLYFIFINWHNKTDGTFQLLFHEFAHYMQYIVYKENPSEYSKQEKEVKKLLQEVEAEKVAMICCNELNLIYTKEKDDTFGDMDVEYNYASDYLNCYYALCREYEIKPEQTNYDMILNIVAAIINTIKYKHLYEHNCSNCNWYDKYGDPSDDIGAHCACEDIEEDGDSIKVMGENRNGESCSYWRYKIL